LLFHVHHSFIFRFFLLFLFLSLSLSVSARLYHRRIMFKRVSLPLLNSFATKIIVKTSENSRQEVPFAKAPKTFVSGNNIFRKRKSRRFGGVFQWCIQEQYHSESFSKSRIWVQMTPDGHVVTRQLNLQFTQSGQLSPYFIFFGIIFGNTKSYYFGMTVVNKSISLVIYIRVTNTPGLICRK